MKFLASVIAIAALCATPTLVDAHSYLVKPVGRIQQVRTDVDNSIGCPTSEKGQVTSFKAGETIDVSYWRNNHLGGFIRWAIVPFGKETKANFDNNVFYYTCRESGPTCVPKGQNQRYSGDGGSGDNSISCGDKITLPDYLPAGDYVIQWMWYGVGSSYGNIGWAEPQFKSCADIKLTTSGTKSKPSCPPFVGGDRVTKLENKGNDVCFYFHSNAIAKEQYKGSNTNYEGEYKFGKPAELATCSTANDSDNDSGAAGNSTVPATPAPAPKTNKPVTTAPQPNPAPAPKPNPAPAPMPSNKCKVKRNRRN